MKFLLKLLLLTNFIIKNRRPQQMFWKTKPQKLSYPQQGIIVKTSFSAHTASQHLVDYENDIDKLKKFRVFENSDLYLSQKVQGKQKKLQITILKSGTACKHQLIGTLQYNKTRQQGQFRTLWPEETYKVDRGNGFQLQLGSILKIGRLKYRVHTFDFVFRQQKLTSVPKFFKSSFNLNVGLKNVKGTCKFCLLQNQTEECEKMDDMLISPCQCKGSCERVHVGCLKYWLQQKLSKQFTNYADYYSFKNMSCELCKAQLPISIIRGGEKSDLVAFNLPTSNYIMLQNLTAMKENSFQGNSEEATVENSQLVVLKFPEFLPRKFQLKIGRSNQCDVRLSDVSVSRYHASIRHDDGKIWLKDNGSKFGTLVQSDKIVPINKKKSAFLQIGKAYFEFTMKNMIEDLEN